MGFTNKAQYLTALLRMLPFGILALYYGIHGLTIKSKIDSLHKVSGDIISNGSKNIYSELSNTLKNAYFFQILDQDSDTIECYTFVTKYRKRLSNIKNAKGEHITVWCDFDDNNIRQIAIDNQMIINYSRPSFIYLLFVVLGGIYTIVTLLYLIKYPEHLYKKRDDPS